MELSKQLKLIRKIYKGKIYEIEKTANISHQLLYDYENGKKIPSIENCIKLADYYKISLDELVGRDFF